MALNTLYPAAGVISYTTPFGVHKMTIPTLAWSIAIGTHGKGGYTAWDGTTSVDAQDMWEDLINDLAAFVLADTSFDSVTLYTYSAVNAPANPVMFWTPAIVGTNTTTTQRKAVQQTWNFRTADFGRFKLTLLDGPIGSNWDKIIPSGFGSADLAIVGALTDLTKAWSGRDNSAPAAAISKTFTLNDKLRREYGMS